MGCDIHMVIEYADFTTQDGELHWEAFGGMFNPGRDYDFFGILAGVRTDEEPLYPRKGYPEGRVSFETQGELSEGDEDLHSHTWLTAEEYLACYGQRILHSSWGPPDVSYELVQVMLFTLKERNIPARVVMAFDN